MEYERKTIIALRHPETIWENMVKNPEDPDQKKRLLGATDIPLSANGILCAERVAIEMERYKPDRIVASSLIRARQLAEKISEQTKLPIAYDDRFREIDFGLCEGITFGEMRRQFPTVYNQYIGQESDIDFPNGESFITFEQRVLSGLRDVIAAGKGTTVIVTHGGATRMIILYFLKLGRYHFWNLKQDHGAINVFHQWGDTVMIDKINHTVEK